jgi:c-di-GMP-binding flagellar brake protein YcgR
MTDAASADEGRFRIHSRVEIAYILRSLMKSNALVTAYFGSGKDFVVTAVLEVDDRGFVVLDSGSNPELNERLLRSGAVDVMSTQDGVRVQFASRDVQPVSFEGRLAFRLPLPDSLLKLQRREFYRLPTPLVQPLKCEFTSPQGERYELPLADISLGGVCLVGEAAGFTLESGVELDGCRITLPDVGMLQTRLCVRNCYTVTLKNGVQSRRTGCEFVKLGPQQEAMVQRYIMRLERERRARHADRKL